MESRKQQANAWRGEQSAVDVHTKQAQRASAPGRALAGGCQGSVYLYQPISSYSTGIVSSIKEVFVQQCSGLMKLWYPVYSDCTRRSGRSRAFIHEIPSNGAKP